MNNLDPGAHQGTPLALPNQDRNSERAMSVALPEDWLLLSWFGLEISAALELHWQAALEKP